jgi:hypothetical protein
LNDLAVLASETHEQAIADFRVAELYTFKFIMKIKKIREERLYKELGFQSFDSYCEAAWKQKRDYMDQRIQIAESFGEADFADTYRQLGHSKSLIFARMEPETRQQIESTVNVSEAPVREIKQLEKQLKETESERVRLENESVHYRQLLNQERSKPQQVRQVQVEVLPSDYQDLKTQAIAGQKLNTENVRLQRQLQQMKEDTTRENETALNCKKLKESLKNLLSIINQEHYNAKFYFDQVAGSLQTFQIVQDFQQEFNEMITAVLLDWKDRTDLNPI